MPHPNVEKVTAILTEHGHPTGVRTFAEGVRTAVAAAEQLGVEVGAIANSLVFDADGEPVLILASGAHRVDTDACATLFGVRTLRRADPEFVRTATGQTIGGVAPVGHPQPLRTLVDVWLRRHPTVWAAAGHPNSVFLTTFDALVTLTGGTPADVGE